MDDLFSSENRTAASAVRFQRSAIAFLSLMAVIFQTPIPLYFVILTSGIGALISPRFELLRLFYFGVIKKLLKKDLFSFKHIFPGSFLLDKEVDRFIFSGLFIVQGFGVLLYHLGVKWWVVPVAIAAGLKTLSATIGICAMAYVYAIINERRQQRFA